MSDTFKEVQKFVAEHLAVDPEKVTKEAVFIDDLGADSLDSVEIVMAAEEAFGIEIPDEESERLLTVGALVDFVDKAKA